MSQMNPLCVLPCHLFNFKPTDEVFFDHTPKYIPTSNHQSYQQGNRENLKCASDTCFVSCMVRKVKPRVEGEVVSLLNYDNKDVSGSVSPSILHFDMRTKWQVKFRGSVPEGALGNLLTDLAYPGFFFWGGGSLGQKFFTRGVQQIQLRTEGRETGDLRAVAP
jgi:hypothetical protein